MTANEDWSEVETTSWLHIVPNYDMAYHTLGAYCPCRPLPQRFQQGFKRILEHNAFDAREFFSVVDRVEPIQFELPVAVDLVHFSSRQQ